MHDDEPGAEDVVGGGLAALVAEQLPQWLPVQRWFGDKGRAIDGIRVIASFAGRHDGAQFHLTVVRVQFLAGEPALYLLPLGVEPDGDGATAQLVDATALPQFGPWLLEQFLDPRLADGGAWRFQVDGPAATLERARESAASVMGAEQSNTSIRYDDALIVKLFRRLQPGPNPDEEMLRALSTTRFAQSPTLVATATWRATEKADFPIALAQEFVPNRGDGWSWMLARLSGLVKSGDLAGGWEPEWRLGRRTGELHLALSNLTSPDFLPEETDVRDVTGQMARTVRAAKDVAALLIERQAQLPSATREILPAVIDALENASERAAGFQAEVGLLRARVHGDFHLGQTLRTLDDDWEIIDFEGEPARPVSERRQKVSVLKDVAGMLRSFAYARGAMAKDADAAAARERLSHWEQEARQAFLTGYREVLRATGSRLVPAEDAAFAQAVAAWEFDKAIYEIAYEARNRPDWLEIPLRSLFPELFAQAPDVTGAAPA